MKENKTVETFSEKILRMFLPQTRRRPSNETPDKDLETIDPLERFENAIRNESESKKLCSEKHKE